MAEHRNTEAYEITWMIRRLFRAMASLADAYLGEADLTAADRAVMEFLYPDSELSVPDIARRYDVSRQHVQVTVNALVDKGLLRSTVNPQHKRSRLIRLSGLGKDRFAKIRRSERAIVAEMFVGISDDALGTTHETLNTLLQRLK